MSGQPSPRPDKEPPEAVKKLVNALANALNEEVRDSRRIQALLKKIEEAGYDPTLSLAVLVGLVPQHTNQGTTAEFRVEITQDDQEFLDSLRIRYPQPPPEGT